MVVVVVDEVVEVVVVVAAVVVVVGLTVVVVGAMVVVTAVEVVASVMSDSPSPVPQPAAAAVQTTNQIIDRRTAPPSVPGLRVQPGHSPSRASTKASRSKGARSSACSPSPAK